MTEVTKSELARKLGVAPAMISKHVKSGILDKCFTKNGKKLYLEKAIESITLSQKRDPKKIIDAATPKDIKNNEQIYNSDSEDELKGLIDSAQSPSQKVQIVKDFWIGRINRQKFLESEGELISVDDAKAAIEELLSPLNRYLDDLGNSLKNHFPDISDDVMEWINEENNRQKEQLRVHKWD